MLMSRGGETPSKELKTIQVYEEHSGLLHQKDSVQGQEVKWTMGTDGLVLA